MVITSTKSKAQSTKQYQIKTSSKFKIQSSKLKGLKFKVQSTNAQLDGINAKASSKLKIQSSKLKSPKSKVQSTNAQLYGINAKANSKLKIQNSNVYLEELRTIDDRLIIKENTRPYDLESRTFSFAKQVIALVGELQKSIANIEIGKQVVRSAGSVGANYIEAGESLSDKDFMFRIKICRKEAKESCYWLKLLDCNSELNDTREELVEEAFELTKIFCSIVYKNK